MARIHAIRAEFPRYGYRRVAAQLKGGRGTGQPHPGRAHEFCEALSPGFVVQFSLAQ